VSEISKTMGTQMPAIKKERENRNEKDSPCSLAKVFFEFQTREICFKEHSRIRIATIYIFHTHTHLDLRV
jgi:hypothetical protein